VEREAPDLVLCGVQSSDAINGATGIALAGLLDLAHVAVVRRLDYDSATTTATVERELEGGLVEVLRVRTPALFTIQTGINQPRYATLRAIKQAREKPLVLEDLAALGLDRAQLAAAAGSRRRALAIPDRSAGAEMLAGSAQEMATRIAELVRERTS
jgi:electron transfer flavoprotein beta subunit